MTQSLAPTSTVLILVGDEPTPLFDALAQTLTTVLQIPVETAFLEAVTPSIGESIQQAVAQHHPQKVIILPVFTGVNLAKQNNVKMIVAGVQDLWSDVALHYGQALGTHAGVVLAYHALIPHTLETVRQEPVLLVVGRGSRDAQVNAEVYQMARLLWERGGFTSFEVAYCTGTQPDIAMGIHRCVQLGARRIVVLPYLLYDHASFDLIQKRLQEAQSQYLDVRLRLSSPLGVHDGVVEAINQRYQEALGDLNQQLALNKGIVRQAHSHGANGEHSHALNLEWQALLPPRYQNDAPVSASPMGSADLVYDANGQVAWDEVWTDFCDLALAGGPPHRGTLLEPINPDIISRYPQAYQQVLAEVARGIRLVTHLDVLTHRSAGWIGIKCDSEAMAVWLLRAIIVENVSVRREDTILFLPISPHFRLEHEIKNLITVVAKTLHYWTEHVNGSSSPSA